MGRPHTEIFFCTIKELIVALTSIQQAFLTRVANQLENPTPIILTPEQIAAHEAWKALSAAEQTIERFKSAKLSLLMNSIHTIGENWKNIWENDDATPAEMLAAMGTDAVAIFTSSAQFTQVIYDIGQSMNPVISLDSKYLSAKFPYVAHADGTITLA